MTTREKIRRHYQTLTSLRRRSDEEAATPPPHGSSAHSQVEVQESHDAISMSEEEEEGEEEEGEEEEESEVRLALSESSPSSTGSVAHDNDPADPQKAESESDQEVITSRADDDDDEESVVQLQEEPSSPQATEEEEDQQQSDEEMFAQDYLLRVCDTVQVCPGLSEQLLQVLDQSSGAELLYDRLSDLLQPWPQLLRDFAAFLTRRQARRCGLLEEQQLFERSRRFLRRLGRSLGKGSALYQQVVSVLQGSSAPPPELKDKISSLLKRHPALQEEFWEFFQQLHTQPSSLATNSDTTVADYVSQNPPDGNRKRDESKAGSGREEGEESGRAVCAKNISVTSSGEKVVVWTREADRAILTACQQRGANRKTFRHISAQLGNKTAQQVSLRFQHLINLFHFQKSTSCSSDGRPISTQQASVV